MPPERKLHHKIWGIAWPAILSNISIPLLGLVDAAILGRLGSPLYIGAVAIGAAILSFVYWGFSFLRMGTTGLVATRSGAGEHGLALLVLYRSMILGLGLALLVVLTQGLWLPLGLSLMAPRDEVAPLAASYVTIRVYSAPAVLATYAVVGWFIGRQNTRWPMLVVLVTNLSNIGLDIWLILGLGMQSDGAALATLLAEYLGCGVALWGLWLYRPRGLLPQLWQQLRELSAYSSLLKANRDLFIRTTCLLFSFAFFTAQGDKLGAGVLAANAIMIQLLLLAAFALDGFAYAAEALAGDRIGAADLPGFHRVVKATGFWCAVTALLLSLAFLLLQTPLYNLLTTQEPLRALLQRYHLWLVLLPLIAAPSYLLDGIFIGTSTTRPMMTTMLASTLLVYLPCWYFTRAWGNDGLWLSFLIFNGARGVLLGGSYWLRSRRELWL